MSALQDDRPTAVERALDDPDAAPIGRLLDDGFSEEQVPRLWRGVEQRSLRGSFARRHGVALLAAAALLLVLGGGALHFFDVGAPLMLASGDAPAVFDAARSRVESRFADGSRIELGAGSRMEVLRNDGRSFVSVLQRGEGTFEVEPGGPRRWVVHAGIANVEVIGTRFRVARTPGRVEVSVIHGVVMVLAESLPGGSVRLNAGEDIVIRAPSALDDSASPAPAHVAEYARSALAPSPPAPSASAPSSEHSPMALPATTARTAPTEPAGDAIDELFRTADRARARGDTAAAVAAYEAVLARTPARDPRRGLAAMSLTRLTMRGDPARAASALDESMPGMPSALAEDALARQVEAEGRSGRLDEAARLARLYLSRFPDGRRGADVRRWLPH